MEIAHQSQPENESSVSKRSIITRVFLTTLVIGVGLAIALLPRIFAEISYPLAYEDVIKREATAHDLDPYLVAGVIYAESRFKPTATSGVGARGLMQIMPFTGQGIARRLGESFTTDSLYDPETNIRYGTFHLQGLMGRYSSNVEAALVAYNGGGGAGDRFVRGDMAHVPNESLRYYKKVLDAKAKYQELYSSRLGGNSDGNQLTLTAPQETMTSRLLRAVQQTVAQRISQ